MRLSGSVGGRQYGYSKSLGPAASRPFGEAQEFWDQKPERGFRTTFGVRMMGKKNNAH